jgi:subtilisin family serine protease
MYKKGVGLSLLFASTIVNASFYYSKNQKIELIPDSKRAIENGIKYFRTLNGKSIGVDNTVLLKFKDDSIDVDKFLTKYDLTLVKKLSPSIYKLSTTNDIFDTANRLYELDEVKFAHPNLYVEKIKRATTDPLYSDAWHLDMIDVEGAWKYSKGSGIKIGIIDDGFDIDHEDLKDNIVVGYDFDSRDSDPSPTNYTQTHGTNCAGVILAVENNIGSVGVAPQSKLYPVKWNGAGVDTTIEAFEWLKNQDVDVISNSWGTYAIADALDDEFKDLATTGRDGKGIVLVFASGNDSYNLDEIADGGYYDGETLDDESESPWVIGVGATNPSDTLTYYSNYGTNIDIVAPAAAVTTDVTGIWGDNATEYTDEFGGTSAAAPLVSGVVALILGANPNLTKSEVESIIKTTADKIGGVEYDSSGFNLEYSYGRINAKRAVELSYNQNITSPFIDINSLDSGWHLLGTQKELESTKDNFDLISLWTYKDGLWSKNPTLIEAGAGFWINKKYNATTTQTIINSDEVVSLEPFVDIDSFGSGWHLLGTEERLGDIKSKFGLISVWTYDNYSWSKNPTTIEAGSGYWIHK